MSKSKTFLYISIFFIIGILIRSLWEAPFLFGYAILLVGLISAIIFWKQPKIRIIGLGLAFLFLGMLRFDFSIPKADESRIEFFNEQNVTFIGVVSEDADIRVDHVKLKVESLELKDNEQKVSGVVLVKTFLYPQYDYGDKLELNCDLRQPTTFEGFEYDKYLARYNIYSTCYYPKITLLSSGHGNFIFKGLYYVKAKFMEIINKILPEPQASFLAGILIGARRGIPQDLTLNFNRTGITHIVAISGYNITIIAVLLMILFKNLFIPRKKAFWMIVVGILFFTIITGATAAVVRASIMGIIVLLAKQMGRASKVFNILVLTCLIMLLINPKILFFDIGFQLSFLATLGLIYVSPIFEEYTKRIPELFGFKEALITTLSAILMTTPIILYNFERFSIVAPLVNVLILPVIPVAMCVGFIAVTGGLIWIGIGKVVGWAVWFLLGYVILMAEWFGSLPWASIEVPKLHWSLVVAMYVLIGWFYYLEKIKFKKQKVK
jgi:competence protein ComEC